MPSWVAVDAKKFEGTFKQMPERATSQATSTKA
jgi:small subunit ribosomal protein S4